MPSPSQPEASASQARRPRWSPEQGRLARQAFAPRPQIGAYLALLVLGSILTSGKFVLVERLMAAKLTGASNQTLFGLLLATCGCWLAGVLTVFWANCIGFHIQKTIAVEELLVTADRMLRAPGIQLHRFLGGRAVFVLRTGMKSIGKAVGGMIGAVTEAAMLIGVIGLAFWMQPLLGLVTLLALSLAAWRALGHLDNVRRGTNETLDSGRQLHSSLCNLYLALPLVKLFGTDRDGLLRFLAPVIDRQKQGERLCLKGQRGVAIEVNLASALSGVVILLLGYQQFVDSRLEVSALAAALLLNQSAFVSIRRMLAQWTFARQYEDFLASFLGSEPQANADPVPRVRLNGPIELVEFREAELMAQKEAFTNVNCRWVPGTVYGITGPSAWANQKLLRLLADRTRMIGGELTVNGVPGDSLDDDSYEGRIFSSKINALLLKGSLADNLRIARGDATDEELVAALEQAGFADDLARLAPHGGLNAPLGGDDIHLSPGQIQRISIARGFLRSSDILMLDDPYLSLDERSARIVMASLREHARRRIVVVVANRAQSAGECDELLVMGEHSFVAQTTVAKARTDASIAHLLDADFRQAA